VYVWRANPWLTPLPRLLKLNDVVDPTNIYGDAAYGRKGADAFVAVALNNTSCAADQVLQTVKGGAATCVARDNNYTCPAGQTLTGITDGQPNCGVYMPPSLCPTGQYLRGYQNGSPVCEGQPVVFGGTYVLQNQSDWPYTGIICGVPNPVTGGCTCPGFAGNAKLSAKFVEKVPPLEYTSKSDCEIRRGVMFVCDGIKTTASPMPGGVVASLYTCYNK
jgi:hypothetical protein